MMTRTTDTDDLRGGKASVDAWIALRVSLVAASASEVILAELIRRIRDNMANDESERAGEGGTGRWEETCCAGRRKPYIPNVQKLLNLQSTSSRDAHRNMK
jgi:hypothetical protein